MTSRTESPTRQGKRATVLVVDDSEDVRQLFQTALKAEYDVKLAGSGSEALHQADTDPLPDIILLDVQMPAPNGYEVCAQLKANPALCNIPVIFITARSDVKDQGKGLALGAADYITKPFSTPLVLARLRNHLALYDQRRALEDQVQQRTDELHTTRRQIIRRLSRAMEYREGGLTNRVLRVSHYVKALAAEAGMDSDLIEILFEAVPLYDIGKIGVPDYILLKTDQLNKIETTEMRRHPEIGAHIIGKHETPLLATARLMALTHHERWDGKGYPKGLSGEAIPLVGRILAIADAYEAMTATQRHRSPFHTHKAERQIIEASGTQFDPQLVTAFKNVSRDFEKIRRTFHDELEGIHDLDFTQRTAPFKASRKA
ncbi:MAG: HD domain-containing phosphohydrolase [Burkholderiales bacterium]